MVFESKMLCVGFVLPRHSRDRFLFNSGSIISSIRGLLLNKESHVGLRVDACYEGSDDVMVYFSYHDLPNEQAIKKLFKKMMDEYGAKLLA